MLYYFVIEAVDGVGKTTQISEVLTRLEKEYPNAKIISTREPGGTTTAEKIRDILKTDHLCKEAEALLFAAARAELLTTYIEPMKAEAIDQDVIFVSDRNFFSSLAYQGDDQMVGDMDKVYRLNKEWAHIEDVVPTALFYLSASDEIIRGRKSLPDDAIEKSRDTTDLGKNYFTVIDSWRVMGSGLPVHVIDASGSISKTHEQIFAFIQRYIAGERVPILDRYFREISKDRVGPMYNVELYNKDATLRADRLKSLIECEDAPMDLLQRLIEQSNDPLFEQQDIVDQIMEKCVRAGHEDTQSLRIEINNAINERVIFSYDMENYLSKPYLVEFMITIPDGDPAENAWAEKCYWDDEYQISPRSTLLYLANRIGVSSVELREMLAHKVSETPIERLDNMVYATAEDMVELTKSIGAPSAEIVLLVKMALRDVLDFKTKRYDQFTFDEGIAYFSKNGVGDYKATKDGLAKLRASIQIPVKNLKIQLPENLRSNPNAAIVRLIGGDEG